MTDIIINPGSIDEVFDGTNVGDHFEDHDVLDKDIINGGEGNDTVYYDYTQPVFSTSGKEVVLYFDLSGNGPHSGKDYLEYSKYFLYVVKDTYNSIENLWGTQQSDHIHGNDANNEFYGFAGNDVIYGYDGDDRIYGGDGNDRLHGGKGNNYLDGGAGNDVLSGNGLMYGREGDDYFWNATGRLYGGSGNDEFEMDRYNNGDIIHGGEGNDLLICLYDHAFELGNRDNSVLYYDLNNKGAEDHDYYTSLGISETGDTGSNNGTYWYVGGTTSVIGGSNLYYSIENIVVEAGQAAHVFGTEADNIIEILYNTNYDNVLYGYGGDDTLISEGNHDILNGGEGADRLFSNHGDDTLYGEQGDDYLNGGIGADYLDGGEGFDIASYSGASAGVNANLAMSSRNTGDAAGDQYISIEGLAGSRHNDNLYGDGGDNLLTGNGGADTLYGRGGNDTLNGGAGNDKLYGDGGDDTYLFSTFYAEDADIISDSSGNETLSIEFAYDSLDASLTNNQLLLVFQQGSASNSITISNWGYGDAYQIEEFQFGEQTYNADQFLLENYGIA